MTCRIFVSGTDSFLPGAIFGASEIGGGPCFFSAAAPTPEGAGLERRCPV